MSSIRVVAGVLIEDGRVLAAQRAPGKHQAGRWELPGGKTRPSESDAQALARELTEELSITVRVGARLGESTYTYPHATITLVAYRCERIDGVPTAIEHAQLRWVEPDQLASLDWAPADRPFVAMLSESGACI